MELCGAGQGGGQQGGAEGEEGPGVGRERGGKEERLQRLEVALSGVRRRSRVVVVVVVVVFTVLWSDLI